MATIVQAKKGKTSASFNTDTPQGQAALDAFLASGGAVTSGGGRRTVQTPPPTTSVKLDEGSEVTTKSRLTTEQVQALTRGSSFIGFTRNSDGTFTPTATGLDRIGKDATIFKSSTPREGGSSFNLPATLPVSQTPQSTSTTYTVKSGDTLGDIAARFGVSINDISGFRSGNPDLIFPGEKLTIGKQASTQAEGATFNLTEINEINTIANTDAINEADILSESGIDLSDATKLLAKLVETLDTDQASRPVRPSLLETFNEQRAQLGVGALETKLANVDKDIAALDADFSSGTEDEESRRVSVRKINQRLSENERQYNRQRRDLVNERNSIANELNVKYSAINTIVSLTSQDYQLAIQEYNSQYSQAIQMINLVRGLERDIRERAASSRATATSVLNMLSNAGVDINDLDPSILSNIDGLMVAGGFPTGLASAILESMATRPNDEILYKTTRTSGGIKYVDILYKNKNTGDITVETIPVGSVDKGGDNFRVRFGEAQDFANQFEGSDEALKNELLRNFDDLSVTDTNSIIADRTRPEQQIKIEAISIVREVFENTKGKIFRKGATTDTDEDLLEKAKKQAVELANNPPKGFGITIAGGEANKRMIQQLIQMINAITLADIGR